MPDFRDLVVWGAAHRLGLRIYEVTDRFPRSEVFGLTSQLRRAATSIASNIAEGNGRGSDREFRRFLHIARASAHELMSQLLFARDRGLLTPEDAHSALGHAESVARMLSGLITAINKRVAKPKPDHPP